MATRLLKCTCGNSLTIDESMAGLTRRCNCGATLSIPSLSKLRRLPSATEDTEQESVEVSALTSGFKSLRIDRQRGEEVLKLARAHNEGMNRSHGDLPSPLPSTLLMAPESWASCDRWNINESGEILVARSEPIPESVGRYKVHRLLGRGGFGAVYLAHDPRLDRPVALKLPRRDRFKTAEQVATFLDEARTAAKLKHPALVAVYDVEEYDGLPYIIQEYIEGEDLAEWTAANRPSFSQTARILADVTKPLGYLHQQGLTHCDLKLANVLMDAQVEKRLTLDIADNTLSSGSFASRDMVNRVAWTQCLALGISSWGIDDCRMAIVDG